MHWGQWIPNKNTQIAQENMQAIDSLKEMSALGVAFCQTFRAGYSGEISEEMKKNLMVLSSKKEMAKSVVRENTEKKIKEIEDSVSQSNNYDYRRASLAEISTLRQDCDAEVAALDNPLIYVIKSSEISIFGFDTLAAGVKEKNFLLAMMGIVKGLLLFSWKVVTFIPKVVQCLVHATELALLKYYLNHSDSKIGYVALFFARVLGIIYIILRQIFSPEEAAHAAIKNARGLGFSEKVQMFCAAVSIIISVALIILLLPKLIVLAAAALVAIGVSASVVAMIIGGPLCVISNYVPKVASFLNMLGGLLKTVTDSIGYGVKAVPKVVPSAIVANYAQTGAAVSAHGVFKVVKSDRSDRSDRSDGSDYSVSKGCPEDKTKMSKSEVHRPQSPLEYGSDDEGTTPHLY